MNADSNTQMVSKAHWCSHQAIYEAKYPKDEDMQQERACVEIKKGDVM
jgi:hypothetical protein